MTWKDGRGGDGGGHLSGAATRVLGPFLQQQGEEAHKEVCPHGLLRIFFSVLQNHWMVGKGVKLCGHKS